MNDEYPVDPLSTAMVRVFGNLMRQMMFCLPGKVANFDPDNQTATVEVGIQKVGPDGTGRSFPTIDKVPVCFPGDSHYLWHAVESGCEGLIHFSQRSIDEWLDRGGPVAPADGRMLSLKDAFFVPGFRSRGNRIPGFRNSGAGISDKDGENYVWLDGANLKAAVATAEVTAVTAATVTAPLITLQGNVAITGNLAVGGAMTNDGVPVGKQHRHDQGPDSDGDTQQRSSTPV
ncbi:Gp138 family membrane-puncturing spike protein [Alloalcanivorax xenomutans]